MRTFSHVGIPTTAKHDNEHHNVDGGFFVTDYNATPTRIEWLRCEAHCELPEVIQKSTHVAFVVDDLTAALEGAEILVPPMRVDDQLEIAFIFEDGAPVELMHYKS